MKASYEKVRVPKFEATRVLTSLNEPDFRGAMKICNQIWDISRNEDATVVFAMIQPKIFPT